MQWLKWTMIAAAGCLPAMTLADEPAKTEKPPHKILVEVAPQKGDDVQVFLVGDEDPQLPPERRKILEQLRNAQKGLELTLANVKREKGSYLGISTAPPPAVLRKQLGLAPGMGLVIEFVVPESPAAKAGVQPMDVLQKLDDQFLVNREQLTVLVRSHKPGDEVKLGVIREGKPVTLTARLIEHDVEPLAEGAMEFEIERMLPDQRFTDVVTRRPGQGAGGIWGPISTQGGAASSVTWIEGDRSYALVTNREGRKTFTAKGKDGKILFEGPINTKEERDKVPADLKEKLDALQQKTPGGWYKAQLGGRGANPATQPRIRANSDKNSNDK